MKRVLILMMVVVSMYAADVNKTCHIGWVKNLKTGKIVRNNEDIKVLTIGSRAAVAISDTMYEFNYIDTRESSTGTKYETFETPNGKMILQVYDNLLQGAYLSVLTKDGRYIQFVLNDCKE